MIQVCYTYSMTEPLKVYYPIRPFYINQKWGENKPCVKNFGETNQKIVTGASDTTCPVGYEKLYPLFNMRGHNGIDVRAVHDDIHSSSEGTVVEVQTVPARGLGVGILTDVKYDLGVHGEHYVKFRYWHMQSIAVHIGQKVKVGDFLGVTNNTGYSSGNHLHWEMQPYDKDAGGHPVITNPTGHIAGTVDMEPYFTGIYADEASPDLLWLQSMGYLLQSLTNKLQELADLMKK